MLKYSLDTLNFTPQEVVVMSLRGFVVS